MGTNYAYADMSFRKSLLLNQNRSFL